jgi:hypothetical protein
MNITKELLSTLIEEQFFSELKSLEEVAGRLDQKGFTLKGKQLSLLSQLLTYLCQDSKLERFKGENGTWSYKQVTR